MTDQNFLADTDAKSGIGKLLRHYWYPVAWSTELKPGGIKKVRLLGEDRVLFRNMEGAAGMVALRCSHRGASLDLGFVETDGLRCPFHGWKFSVTGKCIDIPHGPDSDSFYERASLCSGHVFETGGMIFIYIGEGQPPHFPLIDAYRLKCRKRIRFAYIPCNWVQVMENSFDPVHLEWLHGKYHNHLAQSNGQKVYRVNEHSEIVFEPTFYGFVKRRKLKGQDQSDDDWTIGQQIFFPNMIRISKSPRITLHHKVPVDRENTLYIWYECDTSAPAGSCDEAVPEEVKYRDENGNFIINSLETEDIAAFISQGTVADRSKELLYWIDKGVIAFRRALRTESEKVLAGEAPLFHLREDKYRDFVFEFPVISRENSRQVLEDLPPAG